MQASARVRASVKATSPKARLYLGLAGLGIAALLMACGGQASPTARGTIPTPVTGAGSASQATTTVVSTPGGTATRGATATRTTTPGATPTR